MTIPILLKIRQVYLKQIRSNYSKSNAGFTILEVIIVMLIIGILSAIAVPGWLAFTNRQRTRTVNDGVFRALRSAQSSAKVNKKDVTVDFSDLNGLEETLRKESLGEIKSGMVELAAGKCTIDANDNCTGFDTANTVTDITFNYLGAVENTQALPFAVKVSTPDNGLKRCVIVQTLLGGMRTAEGNNCP
jgi:prepilin-type N-terminal cleavage/methylation domain-containing protein